MPNSLLILLGKLIIWFARATNRGNGSTWPGHIAQETNKNFIRELTTMNRELKIILVAGTNGKTTTSKLIRFLLEKNGLKVFQNESGANLLNGIASTLIKNADLNGKLNFDSAIFEIDENTLPLVLKEIKHPTTIVLLNLFRDQLDRYGEVNTIAKNWKHSLSRLILDQGSTLKNKTALIANGDDPMLTFIAQKSGLATHFFGLDEKLMAKKEIPHDVDFLYCPNCQTKLNFAKMSYSHMGLFSCPKCKFKRSNSVNTYPDIPSPLFGTYNTYNTNAAILIAGKVFNIPLDSIKKVLPEFKAAFGRQEEIEYQGKKIIVQLSKNPAGFNQSIEGILNHTSNVIPVKTGIQKSKDSGSPIGSGMTKKKSRNTFNVLLVLNDHIPDGRDVSWIWDVDTEKLVKNAKNIFISGDRCYDMALRIHYTQKSETLNSKFEIIEHLTDAVHKSISQTGKDETLFILPTYSAMLEVRKILGGKKIL